MEYEIVQHARIVSPELLVKPLQNTLGVRVCSKMNRTDNSPIQRERWYLKIDC